MVDRKAYAPTDYPRDLQGYGADKPKVNWPDGARVAVQFVLNYEEGGENCVLHGDDASEAFLSDIMGAVPLVGQRHMNMESMYEYGSRAGFWRLYDFFTKRKLPVTVFGVTSALAKNPEAVCAMQDADWEIACHGLKWIDYQALPIETERAHIKAAVELHTQLTGTPPSGWYTGRTSPYTRQLLLEYDHFLYDADSYADDLPYWVKQSTLGEPLTKPHLVVPYTLDANDMRLVTPSGFTHGTPCVEYLRDTFDVLYEEGRVAPKMMSIGLHCRLIGRPGRMAALIRFINYLQSYSDVWICRRDDIAHHWHQYHSGEQHV